MRIFVSHGTDKSKPVELDFLDELERQLAQAQPGERAYEVLLDRTRLDAGDDWESVLNDWLAECQGAVLLLSKRALDRPWVLKEATILSYRRQRDPAFPLLPLLLPDLAEQDFAAHAGFSALRLDAIQAFPAGIEPSAVAHFVKDKLAAVKAPSMTPLDRLQLVLENWISSASATALEQACLDWLGEPVAWSPEIDRARQRARVIARVIARGRLGPSITLAGMTRSLTGAALGKEPARKVLDLAASLWVDEEVASRLRAVMARRDGPPIVAALNSARREFGAKMAVWRALLPDIAENVYFLSGASSDGRHEEVVEGMCRAFMEENKEDVGDENEAREMLEAGQEPVVFVLPPPVPDVAMLKDLHAQFPSVIFIAHTGRSLPTGLGAHVAPLTPGLGLDLELRFKADYVAAKKIIC